MGQPGPSGQPLGTPGSKGTFRGAPGTPGTSGAPGNQGQQGPSGPAGPAGPNGASGAKGQAGSAGLVGAPGTAGWFEIIIFKILLNFLFTNYCFITTTSFEQNMIYYYISIYLYHNIIIQ